MTIEVVQRKMGRPKIEIDWGRLDQACRVGCTLLECSGILGASEDVIEFRIREEYNLTFSEYRDKKESPNKELLRQRQWEASLKEPGNPTDRIWLGKQKLGQVDKIEQQHDLSPEAKRYLTAHSAAAKRLEEATIEGEYRELPEKTPESQI